MDDEGKHKVLCFVAIIVSVFGILISALGIWRSHFSDGGRGGAIADALSFFALFISPRYTSEYYEILVTQQSTIDAIVQALREIKPGELDRSIESIKQKLEVIQLGLNEDAKSQTLTNTYLTISAVVGTLSWGFGDLLAKKLSVLKPIVLLKHLM